ncbi:MAG TPA: TIR domain-containing protein [Rhodanobacteraceae bacterium]|nr:TIR domain-containing protein [Rhodanobacteraceae bacterium]
MSYSHRDESWARWLHKALETYRVPSRLVGTATAAGVIPRRLAPVFRDRDELASATDLGRKVNEALTASANLIVICSPHAAASRWVDEEVRAFKRLGRADRIFCLIVDGEPNATDIAGRASEECFCEALRFAVDREGRRTNARAEPIAADARAVGDGKPNARLKLIAGLLDVGFDTLKQREHQRRNRKWAALAAASFAGMLLTGGLSVYALRARSEAIAQRAEAEGLIEFMLGDLRKKLEPVGRLDALDSVGERALGYYAKQNPGALDADSLGRRARALHLIGEVDDLRGNLDHALDVFEQAAHSTSELLARAPEDQQRIFDHAQSVYWVGNVAFQRGQNDVAEASFNEYKRLAERLVVLDPAKDDWQAEVEYAYSNLGTLLIKEGRAAEAVEAFERSLAVSSALARRAPDDVARQLDDAQSRAWLADANEKLGDFETASRERSAELAIYGRVLAADPGNNDAKRSLLVARYALARLSMSRGDVKSAVDELRSAATLAGELMRAEPDSTQWADMSAQAYAYLGEALAFDGDARAARAEVDRACAIAQDLVRRDASVVRWRAFLQSRCDLLRAGFLAESGDHLAALNLAQQVVQRIDALGAGEKEDQLVRTQLGLALGVCGAQQAALGQGAQALDCWQRVVTELLPDQAREDALTQTVLASALSRVGRNDDAAAVVANLDRIGFRHPAFLAVKAQLAGNARAGPAGT